ncbi:hypothetical protein E2C01_069697 [Portunus trituberculatus]|uniref:Uncharacterized protein n=1 Tax=Portunus trituberculatus TaxID=210409 RepID=A0A5B7HQQ7_PORTR|nr:hypothetical protein [Portunus trituberculatus]
MRKHLDQVALFFQDVFFPPVPFFSLQFPPCLQPPNFDSTPYGTPLLLSSDFTSFPGDALPRPPHISSPRLCVSYPPSLPPGTSSVSPCWVAAASAPLFSSCCYFIAFTRPVSRNNDTPSVVALQQLAVCVVGRLELDRELSVSVVTLARSPAALYFVSESNNFTRVDKN